MTTIALVGCAHIHTPGFINAIKQRSAIHVKYVWDPNADVAAYRANELGTKAVENVRTIWTDKEVSAVVICSQTTLHQKLVLAAAKAGKNMFVEKPLGAAAADSYKMADAIEQAGVLFTTGYFQRGNPINLFLRQQIKEGAFGTITRIRGSNCHSGALGGWFDTKPDKPWEDWRWMADTAIAGVGAFGDLGTHSLDILIWLLGEIDAVTGSLGTGTNRYEGTDEFGEAILKFRQGTVGTLAASWDDVADPVTYQISGTEGNAAVVHGKLYFKSSRVEGADGKTPWDKLPPERPAGFGAFLDALEGNRSGELVGAREAAYRSAVMHAIYQGAHKGRWASVTQA